MNEPPGARARVALSGLTQAEYFRDVEGQDVLFFVDNIFRFTQAGSEVSALLGRIPSAVGYQPTLATDMGQLQERITSTNKGSITSVQAIYVPADDLTDPAPATSFAHLDATTTLSAARSPSSASTRRSIRSIRPAACSPPRSSARSITRPPARSRRRCSATRACRTSSPSSAWTSFREEDKLTVSRARKIQRFLSPAVPRRRSVHRHPRQVRPGRGHGPLVQGGGRTANTTICPKAPSTWSAASRKRSPRPRSWRRRPERWPTSFASKIASTRPARGRASRSAPTA